MQEENSRSKEDGKSKRISKQRKFIIRFLYWGIIAGCIFCFGKYLLPILIPFLIAFIVSCILNRPINYVSSKTHINRKIIEILSVISFLLFSSGMLSWLCSFVLNGIENIFFFCPNYLIVLSFR